MKKDGNPNFLAVKLAKTCSEMWLQDKIIVMFMVRNCSDFAVLCL